MRTKNSWILSSVPFLVLLIINSSPSDATDYSFAPGFYKEELPSPILYESFIPIIFKYKYPSMCSDPSANSKQCSGPHCSHLQLLENLRAQFVTRNIRSFTGVAAKLLDNFSNFCSQIQRHFPSLHISGPFVQSYMERMDRCPVKALVYDDDSEDDGFDLKTLRTNEDEAEEMKERTDAVGVDVAVEWLEHLRWEVAVQACISQKIPTTLVSPQNLTDALDKVEESASKQGYKLSIPMSELGAYLKQPLADCAFIEMEAGSAPDTTFLVRILVPIRRKESEPKFYKLHPIQFVLKHSSDALSLCQMTHLEWHRIEDSPLGLISDTGCDPGELCRLEQESPMSPMRLCETALLHYPASMGKYCRFDCETFRAATDTKKGLIQLPIIRRLGSDKLVITGVTNVTIQCAAKHDKTVQLPEIGALALTLPCHCSLVEGSQVYHAEHPCGTEIKQVVWVPTHMLRHDADLNAGNYNESSIRAMLDPGFYRDLQNSPTLHVQIHQRGAELRGEATETPEGISKAAFWALCAVVVAIVISSSAAWYYLWRRIGQIMWESQRFTNPRNSVATIAAGVSVGNYQADNNVRRGAIGSNGYDMNVF